MDLIAELVSVSGDAWRRLSRRLVGLSDAEYLWEPAPACWTVRFEEGRWRADAGVIVDAEPPFTTIAWRMWHLVGVLGAERNARWLALEPEPLDRVEPPGTAAGAIERVSRAYDVWIGCLNRTSAESLALKLGPQAEEYSEGSRLSFVLHQLDEFIHHAAEVAVLRDLYRATRADVDALRDACLTGDRDAVDASRAEDPAAIDRLRDERPDLLVECVETGRWAGVPLLLDLGFRTVAASGHTALHLAAAAGALDTTRLLVDRGADVQALDQTWSLTPLGWARYFHKDDVAAYLEPLTRA